MRRLLYLLLFSGMCMITRGSVPVYRILQVDPANPELRINTVFQDRNGFIWLGTDQGLWRYDGYRFDKALMDSLADQQQVFSIAQDVKGTMFVGMEDGGIIKRGKGWHRIQSPFKKPVNAIVFYQKRMWVATYGDGIGYLENDQWRKLNLRDNSVYAMVLHSSGKLVAGTDLGLVVIDGKQPAILQNLDQHNGLPDNIVRSLFSGNGDTVILGTEETGICEFNLKSNTFTVPEVFKAWTGGTVNCIALLANEYWLGTSGKGIVDYEFTAERRLRYFNRDNGFPLATINTILHDRQGNMWIAGDNKLILSPGEKTEFITESGGKLFKDVNTVTTDQPGYVWLSSGNKLYRYNNLDNSVTQWLTLPQYRNLHITSLAASSSGLWIGTFDNGLYLLDTLSGKAQRFDEKQGLLNPNVISLAVSGDSVWLATLGGIALVNRTDQGGFHFTDFSREGAGRGFVYCVFRDSKGRVWFGTDGQGLVVFENGAFRKISIPGDKAKVIYSIISDRQNTIWFATRQDGVYRYDGKSVKVFNTTDGLRANEISSLAVDIPGNILVIHGKGIDIINALKFTVHPIGVDAGIDAIDPNLNAVATDKIGSVWIGTAQGLLRFYNYDSPGIYEPVLSIRRVFSFMNPGSSLLDTLFEYNQNQISIEYIGLWYGNPESVKYQYRLQGYNNNWITTRDRMITFPNLSPGRYTFEVKATRNNVFSGAPRQSFTFVINPPFWRRWWFIAVAVLMVVAMIYLIIRERTRRLREKDVIDKERIAYQYETLRSQVNPHFLFNSFNTLISIIEENQTKAAEFAAKLSDYFRNMVQYRDKEVISLAQEMELVQTYYYLQQQRFGEYLTISVSLPDEWHQQFGVPPLSLQLLIENAVKHNAVSFETPLHISVTGADMHHLIIRNNLNPKSNPDKSTGIGLENIIHRFRIISSQKVEVRHTATHFEVELPLIKLAGNERTDR